jgi:hypothetical protein
LLLIWTPLGIAAHVAGALLLTGIIAWQRRTARVQERL